VPSVARVIELINPILRGWVNYFAVGHIRSDILAWEDKYMLGHE
jgi:hypothetical protein